MENQSLPGFVSQYFWGDDLTKLTLQDNQKYIIQTLLETGNSDAIHWLFSNVEKEKIKAELPNLKLSGKSANFWNMYLS